MKIALVGNLNNIFFVLARYLRDYELEVDLFIISNDLEHFMPSCDTYSLDFRNYTYTLNLGNPYWFFNEIEKLKTEYSYQIKQLKTYDIIFACSSAPAFLEYFDIKVNFFIPAGIDLYSYPFYIESANPNHREHLDTFSLYQKKSLQKCDRILAASDIFTIDSFKDAAENLSIINKILTFPIIPIVYHKIYNKQSIVENYSKSYWYNDFKAIRESSQLVIFHHSRHVWKSNIDETSLKGNDKLIKAFAKIVQIHSSLKPKLILFEYGDDIIHSKLLIQELKIEDYIIWMPKMNRKDIMVGISLCDITTGEFTHGWSTGGTIFEGLIASKPLLHFLDEQKFNRGDFYPLLNAKEESEIFNQIEYYIYNKNRCLEMAEKAYTWMVTTHTENVISNIVNEIKIIYNSKYN